MSIFNPVIKSFLIGGFFCALTTYLTLNISVNNTAILWSFPFTLIISLMNVEDDIRIKMLEKCSITSSMTFILLNVFLHSYHKFHNMYISSVYGFFAWSLIAICLIT